MANTQQVSLNPKDYLINARNLQLNKDLVNKATAGLPGQERRSKGIKFFRKIL